MKNQQKTHYIVSGENRFTFTASDFKLKDKKVEHLKRDADGLFTLKTENSVFMGRVVDRKQNHYQVKVNGNYYGFTIDREETVQRTKSLRTAGDKNLIYSLRAPMPGKINEIFVREGIEVKKGEPILILEAMKMQNQVLASCDSKVTGIKVKESQTVLREQELVVLQSIDNNK